MAIYLSEKQGRGVNGTYLVTANRHWELEIAAKLYCVPIKKQGDNYFCVINEHQRLRGVMFEQRAPVPNSRDDPQNFRKNKRGGSAGDAQAQRITTAATTYYGGYSSAEAPMSTFATYTPPSTDNFCKAPGGTSGGGGGSVPYRTQLIIK